MLGGGHKKVAVGNRLLPIVGLQTGCWEGSYKQAVVRRGGGGSYKPAVVWKGVTKRLLSGGELQMGCCWEGSHKWAVVRRVVTERLVG